MSGIFLPIHPQHTSNIAAGRKTIEFRRKGFKASVEKMVVYSTYPVKQAIGMVDVEQIKTLSINDLFTSKYEKYLKSGCVSKLSLKEYYQGTNEAVLIFISNFKPFKKVVTIGELPFAVPQSFRYLTPPEYLFFLKR